MNATTPQRPNILWFCTDQQRFDTIGALGNPHVRTPNLDRLVREGVAFTHAYCQSPICTPSRASFLTGQYPSTLHATTNGNDEWDNAAPLVTRTLADAGYDCGLAGKLHLSAAADRIEHRPDDGYRVFHWSHDPRDLWPHGHAYREWLSAKGHDLGALRQRPHDIPPELHQTTWCTDMALDFMAEHAPGGPRTREPWLFSLNCFDPHPAFDPPQPYLDHFDIDAMPDPLFRESDLAMQDTLEAAGVDFQGPARRPAANNARWIKAAYYAMIELIDDNLGRLLDALDRSGQRENTLIVFTSDHGEMLGDHGLVQKGCRFYEGLTRVPLIFSWPGHLTTNRRNDALVELTDIVPTLLDLTGLPTPPGLAGKTLLPLLTRDPEAPTAPNDAHREFVRCEYYRALNPDPQLNPERGGFTGTYGTMLRTRRYKLVVYHGIEIGELYDLQEDPGEFVNLWDSPDHAAIRCTLMKHSFDALAFAVDLGTPQVARF